MKKRKKLQVWLSPIELQTVDDYCERNDASYYSVLKEGINLVLSAEVDQEESPIAPKRSISEVSPSAETVRVASRQSAERIGVLERGLSNLTKEVERLTGNERLWMEVSEIKQRLVSLEGTEELKKELKEEFAKVVEEKVPKMVEDILVSIEKKRSLKEAG